VKSSLSLGIAAVVAACLLVLVVSCSEEESPAEPPGDGNGGGEVLWSWHQQTLPSAYNLYGLHTTPLGRLVAVGAGGVIVTHDGDRWVPSVSPTGQDLWDIHGTSHDNLWAVGDSGTALHFDGSTWQETNVNGRDNLRGVCAVTPDSVYAVGERAAVLLRTGGEWNRLIIPIPAATTLHGVWGNGVFRVFAVGSGNRILRMGDYGWWYISQDLQQPDVTLYGVWGSSETDVFAVGDDGYTTRWDGLQWETIQAPTTESLRAVSGSGWGRPAAVGENGVVLHFSASRWWAEDSGTDRVLFDVNCNLDATDKENRVAVGKQTILESRAGGDSCGAMRKMTCTPSASRGPSSTSTVRVGICRRVATWTTWSACGATDRMFW
jgi:hypothetical protein